MLRFMLIIMLILNYWPSVSSFSNDGQQDNNISNKKQKFSTWSTELTPQGPRMRDVVDFDPLINDKQADNVSYDGNLDWLRDSSYRDPAITNHVTKINGQPYHNRDLPTGLINHATLDQPLPLAFAEIGSPFKQLSNNTSTLHWTPSNTKESLNSHQLMPVQTSPMSLDRIDQLQRAVISTPSGYNLLLNHLFKRAPDPSTIVRFNSLLSTSSPSEILPNGHQQVSRQLLKPVPVYLASNNKNTKINYLLTNKRRSYEPLIDIDSTRPSPINFDDSLETTKLSDLDNRLAPGRREYLASLANQLPPTHESPSYLLKNAKLNGDYTREAVTPLIDNLFAGSKFSYPTYNQPAHYLYHYPASYSLHPHKFGGRKSLEKSLGLPILIGVGAGLISFLIISNLFLSIPLFAMTMMQLNGNNGIVIPPSNNNNSQPPNTPNALAIGRKKRDISKTYFEDALLEALKKHY